MTPPFSAFIDMVLLIPGHNGIYASLSRYFAYFAMLYFSIFFLSIFSLRFHAARDVTTSNDYAAAPTLFCVIRLFSPLIASMLFLSARFLSCRLRRLIFFFRFSTLDGVFIAVFAASL